MMAAAPQTRGLILGLVLLATLAAAVWVSGRDPDSAPATVRPTRTTTPPAASKDGATAKAVDDALPPAALAARTADSAEIPDLFPRQSWFIPPPPPPPTAPPLPFVFLGQFVDGGKVVVFISAGERNFAVRQGEVIDGTYRVDSIAPPTMSLTYLPLNQKQTLEIGRAN